MSHAHTIIGLARSSNVNPKFFLPPRKMSWSKNVTTIIIIMIILPLFYTYINLGNVEQNA